MFNHPEFIVVHHTASARDTTTVQAVNEFHRTKDWDPGSGVAKAPRSNLGWYVQYHYFIEASGKVTQCAQEGEIRWHAGPDANTRSIAICMAGWFDDGHDDQPTPAQVESLKKLLIDLRTRLEIPVDHVVGHRHFMKKTCPGNHITDEWLRGLSVLPAKTDMVFAKGFAGQMLTAVGEHGAIYYVTPDGKRIKIGTKPEEVEVFLQAIRDHKVPTIGITNENLAKIPLV